MVVSAGKMSGLWSGQPNTVKLDELDVICVGMPMTQRAEPELVTSGPYRFVRHPIYSGS